MSAKTETATPYSSRPACGVPTLTHDSWRYCRDDRVTRGVIVATTAYPVRQDDYKRDNEEKIMRAFRAFDPEGKGFIDGEYLKNMLMARGDSFRPKEAQEMLAAAVEESSGRIYYEDFAALLANDGRED